MAMHAASATPAFSAAWVTDGEGDASRTAPAQPERHGSGRRARKGSTKIDYARLAGEYYDDADGAATSSPPSSPGGVADNWYANKHVVRVLRDTFNEPDGILQVVDDGSKLTADALRRNGDGRTEGELSIHRPMLIRDTADSIGMKVPRGGGGRGRKSNASGGGDDDEEKGGGVTIREVGELVGMHHEVTVMDVRSQEELDGWTFADLVDYFEDDSRVYTSRSSGRGSGASSSSNKPPPRVLNQISLEFSHTPLRDLVSSPKFVRDLDWIDNCWPEALTAAGDYPRVQYYCLTSTEGCYTDFHVDFGGTSVWYHVLSGRKVFLLIPPTPTNMKLYEKWLCRRDQNDVFFPDLTAPNGNGGVDKVEGCIRVTLEPHQTFHIPTGWIHAVYTPLDSIVLGGNFLHGLDIPGQLDVHCLETRTRVPAKFRFPNFVRMMFYAGASYLRRLRSGDEGVCAREIDGLPRLCDALRSWAVKPSGDVRKAGSPAHAAADCARLTGCATAAEMAEKLEQAAARAKSRGGGGSGGGPKMKLKLSLKAVAGGSSSGSQPQPSPRLVAVPPSSSSGSPPGGKRPKLKLRLGSFGSGSAGNSPTPSPRDAPARPPASSAAAAAATTPPTSASNTAGGENDANGEEDAFRITIAPTVAVPLPAAAVVPVKRKRTPSSRGRINDLNSAYGAGGAANGDDDEWVPGGGGGSSKKRRSGGGGKKKAPAHPAVSREAVLGAFRAEFGDDFDSNDSDVEEAVPKRKPKATKLKISAAKPKPKAVPPPKKKAPPAAAPKRQSLSSRQRLQKRFKF